MRLIKITAPAGRAADVSRTAFGVGIDKVTVYQVESRTANGPVEIKDAIDLSVSTPQGKSFIDALLAADYFNPRDYSVAVRSPLTVIGAETVQEVTRPLPETATDILEELFQFSHITYSFVGRVFIAGSLLAYGMIRHQLLLMIAGLLFLPLLPPLLAAGYGTLTRHWSLAGRGAAAFTLAAGLLVLSGSLVAAVSSPPLKYDDFNPFGVGFLISLAVGAAAGLANIDDAGKREMIGLAASAQIALIPVWFGICFVFGFTVTDGREEIALRGLSLPVNVITIIGSAAAVYYLSGAARRNLSSLNNNHQ